MQKKKESTATLIYNIIDIALENKCLFKFFRNKNFSSNIQQMRNPFCEFAF